MATSFPERFARLRADYAEVSHPQSRKGCYWLTELTGEKGRNPNPELLVATGTGMDGTSFMSSAAEAPRVARMGADDELLPAASERAETASAASA